jgi:hypothetical protein
MERFAFWTGGSYVNASCTLCDFRMQFKSGEAGAVIMSACDSHDCMKDGV